MRSTPTSDLLGKTSIGKTSAARRAPLTLAAALLVGLGLAPDAARAAAPAAPAACQQIRARYPELKGKTLVNAVNPYTPGYEALDPNDPSHYVGFDIDLAEVIGQCLGFTLTYKPVTFPALMTTLRSGQADIVISDIYATAERAKAADFVTYSKVFDGVLVAHGNPKHITGIDATMCGAAAAENTGYVEVPLIQGIACHASGKPDAALQLYDNNANCIQAILAGRADTYVNDVNTVDQAVKAYPAKLEKAAVLTLPYSLGIAIPRDKPRTRDAVLAAVTAIQAAGIELDLLKKWSLDSGTLEAPKLVQAN